MAAESRVCKVLVYHVCWLIRLVTGLLAEKFSGPMLG